MKEFKISDLLWNIAMSLKEGNFKLNLKKRKLRWREKSKKWGWKDSQSKINAKMRRRILN